MSLTDPILDGNQPFNPLRDRRRNVEINVGKACNNKCVFCLDGFPSPENRKYMAFEDMKQELEHWYAQGSRSVGFLGGEPTTYRHIVESVAYARDLGYTRIAIASNITRMAKLAFADKMLEAGLTRVTVSMHGHTPELEDRLTRVPGVYEKKCAAIRYLKQKEAEGYLKDGVSVNIVLNGWNYRYLPKMMKFFYEDLGLADLRINYVRPEGYAVGSRDLTPQYKDVVPVLIKAIVLNEKHFKKVFTFGGFPHCVLPKALLADQDLMRRYAGEYRDLSTDCSVKADGAGEGGKDAPPDGHTDGVSVIAGGRARFNWQDRKKFDLKGGPSACPSCVRRPVCEGVWKGYLDIYGDAEFEAFTAP